MPSPSRFSLASLAAAAVVMAVPATAGERRVVVGEVSSQVARPGIDYEALLRSASEEEIRALDLTRVPAGKKVVVSVSLVRLDTLADVRATDASCEVNATLRDARRGTIFAILEGRARARSGDGASAQSAGRSTLEARGAVEESAVHGALHGALARIPEVLRR